VTQRDRRIGIQLVEDLADAFDLLGAAHPRRIPRMGSRALITEFLQGKSFAVVGASNDRSKFGNKVLRCYQEHGLAAVPVHPTLKEVEGVACVPDLESLPGPVHGVSIITPPPVTERVVEDAHAAGITRLWMQPGAESRAAVARCKELGIDVIAGGPCLLVELGFSG
jgi:predicted CoA-binding protein